jgi:hypothetical protein
VIEGGNEGGRSTSMSNSELLPSDVIDFEMLSDQRLLVGNSFIVRCHVTTNQPMRAHALGEKFQLYDNLLCQDETACNDKESLS